MSRYWYRFNNRCAGGETIASNYILISDFPDGGCSVGANICLIYAPSGSLTPDPIISGSNLFNYINEALAGDGTPRPVGSKFFVYLDTYDCR